MNGLATKKIHLLAFMNDYELQKLRWDPKYSTFEQSQIDRFQMLLALLQRGSPWNKLEPLLLLILWKVTDSNFLIFTYWLQHFRMRYSVDDLISTSYTLAIKEHWTFVKKITFSFAHISFDLVAYHFVERKPQASTAETSTMIMPTLKAAYTSRWKSQKYSLHNPGHSLFVLLPLCL